MLLNPRLEDNMMPVVIHPFLKDGVEARAYQIRALKNALSSSCLMVMPTGFGKTAVEWMAMAEFLRLYDKENHPHCPNHWFGCATTKNG